MVVCYSLFYYIIVYSRMLEHEAVNNPETVRLSTAETCYDAQLYSRIYHDILW